MELDGFAAGQSVFFFLKCSSESRFAIIVEFLVGESSKDGCLANSCVADCDQFNLSDILLSLFDFRHAMTVQTK